MIGLNFHPSSPRFVTLEHAARLADFARARIGIVALVVNADDGRLAEIRSAVSPEVWQFHGSETFERIRDARAVLGMPVMRALGVSSSADLAAISAYKQVADYVLLDAKPPKDAAYPGGHGRPFDWNLLAALPPGLPFMLSGGLSLANVGEAIRKIRGMGLSLQGVDLSSGVESAPGVKDLAKIKAFVAAVREADTA